MFLLKSLIILLTLGAAPFLSASEEEKEKTENYECESAKEFVVAFSYLTDKDTLKMPKKPALTMAKEIAAGCDGAGARFVHVTETLRRAGLSGNASAKLGKSFALGSDGQKDAFLTIFLHSFLKKYLDLDLLTSVNLAKRLSIEYQGDTEQVLSDYKGLVEFCLDKEQLALPRPRCAKIASDFARLGETSKISILEPFMEGFEFLTDDEDGPKMTTKEAMKLLSELLKVSPYAATNFEEVYGFAHDGDHLKFNRNQAISLARNVAMKTYWQKRK